MKQYVIDQLRESDYERIREFLDENAERTVLEGIYWVALPEELYTETQREHTQCQPYHFAISLDRNEFASELLIRSRNALRCSCIGYADEGQRNHIVGYADKVLEKFEIKL